MALSEEELRKRAEALPPEGRGRQTMEGLLSAVQLHPGLAVAASSLAFRAVHGLLQALPLPKGVQRDDFRVWKWRNLSVSLVHSLLTGTWAISW